jgi:hypothetical protein
MQEAVMEYMKLPIDQVELDLDNPRIKQWLEIYMKRTCGARGWITDHKATKVMCNFIIAGFMVAAMLLMRARVRTIVYTDLIILSLIEAVSTKALSFLIAEAMLAYIYLLLFVQWDEQLKKKGGE